MDEIKFTIIHINEDRYNKRSAIKNALFFYDEVKDIEFVNGHDEEQIKKMRERYPDFRGRPDIWVPKKGEVGVWYSQMQCWRWAAENNTHLLVFEDDAILEPGFEEIWHELLKELPSDYDFFSMFVPNNQEQDYFQRVAFDHNGVPSSTNYRHDEESSFNFGADNVAKVYQGYSCVATMYSPKGGRKLLDIADEHGLYTPVDCFLMLEAHKDKLDGYAPKPPPLVRRMVSIDWNAPTTIHTTDRIDMDLLA